MLSRWEAPTARGKNRHAPSTLVDIANDWDFGCEISYADRTVAKNSVEELAEGHIHTQMLSSGTSLCSSDLTTLRDNERVGVLKRSVMIVVNLDGSPVSYAIDGGSKLRIPAGGGGAFYTADDVRLAATYRRGERSRLLVIQYCPSNLVDPRLAEQLDSHLADTTVKPLMPNCRIRALAQELFSPTHTNVVGQLLAESCALELLARALEGNRLEGNRKVEAASSCPLHPRDVAKIHELCDKLLLNLDEEHRLDDLARDVGMSTSTLKSKFLTVTGQPVFKFLRDKRLDRAQAGLIHESWTVSQAAYYVGYRHPTNFATAYRKRFGMAPTATRASR